MEIKECCMKESIKKKHAGWFYSSLYQMCKFTYHVELRVLYSPEELSTSQGQLQISYESPLLHTTYPASGGDDISDRLGMGAVLITPQASLMRRRNAPTLQWNSTRKTQTWFANEYLAGWSVLHILPKESIKRESKGCSSLDHPCIYIVLNARPQYRTLNQSWSSYSLNAHQLPLAWLNVYYVSSLF